MDEESRKLLLDIKKTTDENHTMLRKMRRAQRNAHMLRGLYWVLIIGLSYAAYVYSRPYLEKVKEIYDTATVQIQGLGNFRNPSGSQ